MRLLVLGGTIFLGRHVVEAALERGHEVTTFTRGTTPGLFPQVEELHGDRDGRLDALRGRSWDAVIDTSGYVPRVVRQSAALLAGSVGHYVFVSSLSVYPDLVTPDLAEDAPLAVLEDPASEDVPRDYGALKAACEQVVEEHFPGRALQARAGLIVGPWDQVDRFNHWVRRVAAGDAFLAPGMPRDPLQLIDVRDLAAWLVEAAARGTAGAFNATGPVRPHRFGEFLGTLGTALGSDAQPVWVSHEFLAAEGTRPMDGVPFWIPPEAQGFMRRDVRKAIAHGLRFRPLAETARDTWAWLQQVPQPQGRKVGVPIVNDLTSGRERELLERWAERHRAG
ncbi:NAD-dependent epimerase/dehydratase family protein [Vulgatibacter sp.]|uniref:NAD-dependent epimerase/dehydratase family protein n=1 Tax=Vulgatibacter sp. TaxID=1971226 RepID=UPI00356A58AB